MSSLQVSGIILALGHGLTGDVPQLPGTISILSVFGNDLEGCLPQLKLQTLGKGYRVLAHSNWLSCALPTTPGLKPHVEAFAMVLTGNSLTEPASFPDFPAWIHATEQSEFFVVSNRHTLDLFVGMACSSLGFCIALLVRASCGKHKTSLTPEERYAICQKAYAASLRSFTLHVSMLACVVCMYLRSQPLACMTIMSRLQL
eukprot:2525952-Amphidinium_carterae.1